MSFSTDIKDELTRDIPGQDHCRMAELTALMHYLGNVCLEPGGAYIRIRMEHAGIAKKVLRLLRALFEIPVDLEIRRQGRTRHYEIFVSSEADLQALLQGTQIHRPSLWKNRIKSRECCCRAFIRGAFLAAGSVSDPGKSYHFEIICRSREDAEYLAELFRRFSMEAGITSRKTRWILYIKDSETIVDALNVMGAFQSLMQMENIRIIKEMRNSANRQSNCDSANISKMVRAAAKQVEDIHLIQRAGAFADLPQTLRDTALARLEYPDVSIQELGSCLDPPVGKSGVNHRLRKLSEIAEKIRDRGTGNE